MMARKIEKCEQSPSTTAIKFHPNMNKSEFGQADLMPAGPAAPLVVNVADLAPEEYAAKEKRLLWKLDLRLMPVLFVIIVLK